MEHDFYGSAQRIDTKWGVNIQVENEYVGGQLWPLVYEGLKFFLMERDTVTEASGLWKETHTCMPLRNLGLDSHMV